MTSLIGIVLLSALRAESSGWSDLGTTSISGVPTAIRLYRDAAPTPTVYVAAGRSYAVFQDRLSDIAVDGLTDSRLKELYSASKPGAEALKWRVKVVVLPLFGFLEVAADGAARVRRAAINEPQLQKLREQLAATEALVEMRTEGRVDLEIDLEVDESAHRLKLDADGLDVSGRDRAPIEKAAGYPSRRWIQNNVEPRFNRGSFDADDRKYRGPFDSRWVIHSGPILKSEDYDDPTGVIQVFSMGRPEVWRRPDGLARDLLRRWENDVAARSRLVGRHAGKSEPWTPPKIWPKLSNAKLVERISDAERYASRSASAVPLISLLDEPKAGAEISQKAPAGSSEAELSALPAMAEVIPSDSMPEGLVRADGRSVAIIAKGPLDFHKWTEGRSSPSVGGPDLLPCGMVEPVGGADSKVFRFAGGSRIGMIRIARPSKSGMLSLELSMTRTEPLAIWHLGSPGLAQKFVPIANIGVVAPTPLEMSGDRPTYTFEASSPRKITLAVEAGEIFIGPSPEGACLEPSRSGTLEVTVLGASVTEAGEATSPDKAASLSKLVPPEAELLAWAASEDDSKRVAALVALSHRKVEGAESVLAEQMKSANPFIAMTAAEALQFHAPQTSRPALTAIIFSGPFDSNRESAANVLDTDGAKLAGPGLSVLLTAPNAVTRATAVKAMGVSQSPETQILMAGFFQDRDPVVRYAAARAANPAVDLLLRRLQFASVNDPSERVRLAALERLLLTDGVAMSEALKGVRDESIWLRIDLLEFIGERANPKHLLAVRNGTADFNPLVRAAALRAWRRFTEPPTVEDLGPALTDGDPRVQMELITIAKHFSIPLSDEVKARLKASIDPEVRKSAEGLG